MGRAVATATAAPARIETTSDLPIIGELTMKMVSSLRKATPSHLVSGNTDLILPHGFEEAAARWRGRRRVGAEGQIILAHPPRALV
jgi:hypothetical protein